MQASLTMQFDDGVDGEQQLRTFVNAERWRRVVEDMADHLRERCKYGDLHETAFSEMDKTRDLLYATLREYDLCLDD